jgi:hypothetical protein
MIIRQFIKKLNNTELGKGNTNDKFIFIPSKADLSDMFDNGHPIQIYDKKTNELYRNNIRYRSTGYNGQIRLNGLGFYWRKYNVSAGDEVIIERIERNDSNTYFIDYHGYENIVLFQKNTQVNGFETLNIDRLESIVSDGLCNLSVKYGNKDCKLVIKFLFSKKKKKTSPEETDFYDLIIDGETILGDCKSTEYIELSIQENDCRLRRVNMWKKSIIEWEE